MTEQKSYWPPVPLGDVMRASGIGEVVESRNPNFPVGAWVSGMLGVQDALVSDGKGLRAFDPKMLPDPRAHADEWEFKVSAIYTPLRRTVDRNTVILRWDYLNNDPRTTWGKDQIGWMMTRTAPGASGADVSTAIDKAFEERDDQTA